MTEPKDLRGVSDAELRRELVPPVFRPLRPRTKSYPLSGPLHVAGVREHWTKRRHRFKCPSCFSVFMGVYNPDAPLPVCMGRGRLSAPGAMRLHPRTLLVSEVFDEYQHMLARFDRGDPTGRPLINPRNAAAFEVQTPAEKVRDLGRPTTSPRG